MDGRKRSADTQDVKGRPRLKRASAKRRRKDCSTRSSDGLVKGSGYSSSSASGYDSDSSTGFASDLTLGSPARGVGRNSGVTGVDLTQKASITSSPPAGPAPASHLASHVFGLDSFNFDAKTLDSALGDALGDYGLGGRGDDEDLAFDVLCQHLTGTGHHALLTGSAAPSTTTSGASASTSTSASSSAPSAAHIPNAQKAASASRISASSFDSGCFASVPSTPAAETSTATGRSRATCSLQRGFVSRRKAAQTDAARQVPFGQRVQFAKASSSAAAAQRQLEEVQSKLDYVTKQYDQLYHTTADQITHQALIIDDLAHHIWAIRELQKARGYFTFGRR